MKTSFENSFVHCIDKLDIMKKLLILLLLVPMVSFGQTKEELQLCLAMQSSNFMSDSEAENALDKILNTIGASANFELTPCSEINNAAATSYKGIRYILYDKEFMQLINSRTNNWSSLAILAHEVGHHINGHALDITMYAGGVVEAKSLANQRKQELEADEFAGFIMAKLGASLNSALSFTNIFTDKDDTYSSHPSKSKRVNAVRKGFNKAGGNSSVADINPSYDSKEKRIEQEMYDIDFPLINPGSETSERKVTDFVNSAIDLSEKGEYLESAKLLEMAYRYGGDRAIDYLYYAASNYVNAPNYNKALKCYLFLSKKNYTGITEKYYLTNKKTKTEEEFTFFEYESLKNTRKYINPRVSLTDSKLPEIVKNIALIYNDLGKKENALYWVRFARENNPGDLGLILTEANIYIELGEKERFKDLMEEAISQDPGNATLYYNLGVVTSDIGDKENARAYYERAIELDPKMENGYLNLVALILEEESEIVNEMNSLGTSASDNSRYDYLSNKRKDIYLECVPILRKLIEVGEGNSEAINTLKNIYGTLGNTEGFMEMKKLLK